LAPALAQLKAGPRILKICTRCSNAKDKKNISASLYAWDERQNLLKKKPGTGKNIICAYRGWEDRKLIFVLFKFR
jgi:hypothetical protein